ncbi:MAG: glycosyltransferase family 4 protein [Bacteroidales bacterium]|nr:glycosyltransferase family 4 protein [Bacteroidales bacterium]
MNKLNNLVFVLNLYLLLIVTSILKYLFSLTGCKKNKIKGVIFLENFPYENAGYQYRASKWSEILNNNFIKSEVLTIVETKNDFDTFLLSYNKSHFLRKYMNKRFRQCLYACRYETIIVRRELLIYNDYGNLFLDKFLLKIHNNVILDFDDNIAAAKQEPRSIESTFGKIMLENGDKFTQSVKLYNKFIVASSYLKSYVINTKQYMDEKNILVIPTCVDYNHLPPKNYTTLPDKPVFGWIGGNHNYFLLDTILPILNNLAKEYDFKLLVIGGENYIRETDFTVEFVPWSLKTEIEDLLKIDFGLMPLINDDKSKGKGGFKLIQYMGLGIVSIASAVTINCDIIENGSNSFLAKNQKEWEIILKQILEDRVDLLQISKSARLTIENKYTFDSNLNKYLNFLSL